MNTQTAVHNTADEADTQSKRTIQRPWITAAAVTATAAIALVGGLAFRNSGPAEEVTTVAAAPTGSVTPSLADSLNLPGKVPQPGLPDGTWLAETSGAASSTSAAVSAISDTDATAPDSKVPQPGLPDGTWLAETSTASVSNAVASTEALPNDYCQSESARSAGFSCGNGGPR